MRPTLLRLVAGGLLGLLAACHPDGPSRPAPAPAPGASGPPAAPAPPAAPLLVGEPELLPDSEWVLYPLLLGAPADAPRKLAALRSYGSDGPPTARWEILFYNGRTGQVRPLVGPRRVAIWSVEPAPADAETQALTFAPGPYTGRNLLLYSVTTTDFDHDGQLTEQDPACVFVSTKSGEFFRQVSPTGLHVSRWQLHAPTGRLLLTTQRDDNHDLKFDEQDPSVPYVVNLAAGQPATPVLSAPLTRALQRQLAQQWPAPPSE